MSRIGDALDGAKDLAKDVDVSDVVEFIVEAIPKLVAFYKSHSKRGVKAAIVKLDRRLAMHFDAAEEAIDEKHRGEP